MNKVLGQGKYLQLNDENGWEWVTRNNCTGVVVLLPLTDQQELVLVEQYRLPVRKRLIEFPAGLVGDEVDFAEESMLEAARRELEEETGYYAADLEHVCNGPVSAGLTDETLDFYKAKNLTKRSAGGGVDGEDITVHLVPLAEINSWLKMKEQEGAMIDVKVYTGLYLLQN